MHYLGRRIGTYLLIETAVSVCISVGVSGAVTALKQGGLASGMYDPHAMLAAARPSMALSAFMSALLPSISSDWHNRSLTARRSAPAHAVAAVRHVLVAAAIAAVSMVPGVALMDLLLRHIDVGSLSPFAFLLATVIYAGLVAAAVTPVALYGLFRLVRGADVAARARRRVGPDRDLPTGRGA